MESLLIPRVSAVIAGLNAQVLQTLVECARSDSCPFPLPSQLRDDFARRTRMQCNAHAPKGVCLIDAQFADAQLWRQSLIRARPRSIQNGPGHWLSSAQGALLAYAVFMVAWQVVQFAPPLVGVFFGMSEEVREAIHRLRVSDIACLAQTGSGWVRPRWAHRADVWSNLMDLDADTQGVPLGHMRLIQASATDSRPLLATAAHGRVQALQSSGSPDGASPHVPVLSRRT
jgi:hypothetical protein